MSEPLPTPLLARAREQKINELSQHFANDDLSLEDLERRLERVYKATSVADLEEITADLRLPAVIPGAPRPPVGAAAPEQAMAAAGTPYETPKSRLVAIMSSNRRVGRWAVPRDLDMFALMSDNRLDLTNAALPVGGVVNIHLNAIMAAVKIIVSPGMRVINETHSFMADVQSDADELESRLTAPGTPVIRLTGSAVMSEVKVRVRRREQSLDDELDD
jgi:hypothetical protein